MKDKKPSIVFDRESHTYYLNTRLVPSVTQILQDSKICDYSAMAPQYRNYALKRGSYVHKATELYDAGTLDMESIDKQIAPFVQAYIKFRTELNWTLVCSERVVCNPRAKYAGTIDRVFEVPDRGYLLLDIKTSLVAPKWLPLQLAGYWKAMNGDPDMPCISEAAGLCLHDDGNYVLTQTYSAKTLETMFKVFKAAMVVAKFNGRKGGSK